MLLGCPRALLLPTCNQVRIRRPGRQRKGHTSRLQDHTTASHANCLRQKVAGQIEPVLRVESVSVWCVYVCVRGVKSEGVVRRLQNCCAGVCHRCVAPSMPPWHEALLARPEVERLVRGLS